MKFGMKKITFYAIIALLIAVAVLPVLKAMAPRYFPDGFRDIDCQGVTCPEGQFCAGKNNCVPIATRYPNAVPINNE